MKKKLTGTMTIELADAETGNVLQTVREQNMITNAPNDILGLNPAGMFYNIINTYSSFTWQNTMIPICPNMIGGIMLFPKAMTENVNYIFPLSDNLPGAYASNDVNATADTKRGSLNLTESKALDNGYRFVWEFTPSQGNGAIAAAGLTSAPGGAAAYGSSADVTSPFLEIQTYDLRSLTTEEQLPLYQSVEIDFENELLYSISFESTSVIIKKYRFPIFTLGLNEKLNGYDIKLLDTQTLSCSTFKWLGSYTKYGDFLDGKDGYWYGFSNVGNSSGSATMLWIKIKKSDYSFTEGSWTLFNAKLQPIGSFSSSSYPGRKARAVVRNGYLYILAYDGGGIYKINISNSTDITLIEFGFTSALKPLGDTGAGEYYVMLINDLIIGYDFQVTVEDKVIETLGAKRLPAMSTPFYQYKEFLIGWSSSYGSEYMQCFLLTPYLVSINNLSSAVVKTTEMTMKITYELIEQDVSS